LFPGNQISPFRDPELFSAAKNSLLYRGDVSTGWSMAWKINLWAHLLDGNHAYKLIKDQIKPVTSGSGGTYPNFFDAHPPFQIDGNFGCTSGIAEMLVQSYDGSIQLLPAIPDDWKKGSVVGLAARGGFTVDMDWADHRITRLVIHSRIGGNCRVRTGQQLSNSILKKASGQNSNPLYRVIDIQKPIIHQNEKDLSVKLPESWLYDFDTQPGKTYRII
jgi:alpha-L-fucosidase 2